MIYLKYLRREEARFAALPSSSVKRASLDIADAETLPSTVRMDPLGFFIIESLKNLRNVNEHVSKDW